MGSFDKKQALGIGGGLAVLASIIAVVANISEIAQLFKSEKTENSVAVIENVKEEPSKTIIDNENVAEVVEVSAVESAEVIEETVIEQEKVIEESVIIPEEITEPETEPPTEPKPVSIYIVDLDYMSLNGIMSSQSKLEDNIGNIYHNGFYLYGNNGGSANYYIRGKYTNFSGIIAVPDGWESSSDSASFAVYGDDNLLYTSPIMTNTSFPESFSIDITDVQMLTISYPASNTNDNLATMYDGLLS